MKKKKNLLIILSIIIVIAIAVSAFFIIKHNSLEEGKEEEKDPNAIYVKESDNSKINVSKELNKEKEFDGFKVSNIKFTEKDGKVLLIADVTNLSGKDIEKLIFFNITFFDNENKEIGTFPGAINSVKQNETTTLESSLKGYSANYINAYDFKLTIDKSR